MGPRWTGCLDGLCTTDRLRIFMYVLVTISVILFPFISLFCSQVHGLIPCYLLITAGSDSDSDSLVDESLSMQPKGHFHATYHAGSVSESNTLVHKCKACSQIPLLLLLSQFKFAINVRMLCNIAGISSLQCAGIYIKKICNVVC